MTRRLAQRLKQVCPIQWVVLLGWICATAAATAAPLQHDLGQALIYLRPATSLSELPANSNGRAPASVVDVRFHSAEAAEADAFREWLRARATSRTPVFVLANLSTSDALREVLSGHKPGSGIVVVGVPGSGFKPDVPVSTTLDDDRRAFDALGQGTPLASLVTDNPDKVRNDEASLSKDRLAQASADASAASADQGSGKRPPVAVDLTLQRALHLHRALIALRKI